MKIEIEDKCKDCKKQITQEEIAQLKGKQIICKDCIKHYGDPKDKLAEIMINHNLLNRSDWRRFHKEISVITDKYYPKYRKGLEDWFKKGKMLQNI